MDVDGFEPLPALTYKTLAILCNGLCGCSHLTRIISVVWQRVYYRLPVVPSKARLGFDIGGLGGSLGLLRVYWWGLEFGWRRLGA